MFPAAAIFWPPSSSPRHRRRRRGARGDGAHRRANPRALAAGQIVLRADFGFARDGLMAWCEATANHRPTGERIHLPSKNRRAARRRAQMEAPLKSSPNQPQINARTRNPG
jgi:hypothetical protein